MTRRRRGEACRDRTRDNTRSAVCAWCGAAFMTRPIRPGDPNRGKFCSARCRNINNGYTSGAKNLQPFPTGEAHQEWRGGREAIKRRNRERYHSDPQVRANYRARRIVRTAIEAGRLTRQACEVCGQTPADAHHDDYSRPLDVRWLCRRHHLELHGMLTGENRDRRRYA